MVLQIVFLMYLTGKFTLTLLLNVNDVNINKYLEYGIHRTVVLVYHIYKRDIPRRKLDNVAVYNRLMLKRKHTGNTHV